MKEIGILIVATLLLFGCQATGPKIYSGTESPATSVKTVETSQSCSFDQISGKAYLIAPAFQNYVTNNFFYDSEIEKVWQLDKSKYSSLIHQRFKILQTGLVTQEDSKSQQPYLSTYRYSEDEIKGIPYIRDQAFSTKVVTEDCSIFYLSGRTTVNSLFSDIINLDGSKINDDDVLALYGALPLKIKSMDAAITYDRFEKRIKISKPYFNDMTIRGSIDAKTQVITFIQLYVDLTFFDKWGGISSAVDTDGERHEVVKISTDADCSNSDMFGCKLTETVGVTLNDVFLNRHRNGFEIKVFGSKESVIKVSSHMVEGFLIGLEEAKKRAKSGEFGT